MKKIILLILSIFLYAGCSPVKINTNQITVSILPQKYFVEQIAGNDFRINVMIPNGQSPATYEPGPEQIKELSASALYLKIGYVMFEQVNMENFKSINSRMKISDTSKNISLLKGNHKEHHHDKKHNLSSGIDPHVWLSPRAVKIISKNIYNELIKLKPENSKKYSNNLETFLSKIDTLNIKLKKIFDKKIKKGNNKFIVFHPSWSYFARDYNLKQIPIEIEGKEPNPSKLKEIIDTAKNRNIKVIFVQKQFPTDVALSIANDINGKTIYLDPLAEKWLENMNKIAKILEKEL